MLPSMRRRPRQRTAQAVHLPAPLGGINTVDAASAMPTTDAVYLYNLIAAEYGLRSRLGYQEWCTGVSDAEGTEVRSVLPFTGSHKNGSSDKLFACTQSGIWDVSASSSAPTQLVAFATITGDAGWGTSCVAVTPGGRWLLYCDEENGLYYYSETSGSWTKATSGTTQPWEANTAYDAGNQVVNGGNIYNCTAPGVSASSGGPTGTGTGIADGTATWSYVGATSGSAIGPSLADQQMGYAADPASFAFVTVWKNRVWFAEKDSSRGWYLDTNAILGTATSFDFGPKMRAGGPLRGLYGWSYDAGAGLDTLLVGISGAGDVVIYQGTDPTSASTFGLKGSWYVGGVPAGRRIATDYGGDILVLSLLGVVPLSKLILGQPVVAGDRSLYATGKIANTFNLMVQTHQGLAGWALHVHPTDNALLVCIPTVAGQATTQLAMSFATRGWSQYRDLPILSAGVWGGTLYFGTVDGRVCKNTGYVDGVQLANANAYTPVSFSGMTAFQNGGDARNKRLTMVRPSVLSEAPSAFIQCTAKYGFDLSEPAAPSGSDTGSNTNSWDTAVWDSAVWGGDYSPTQPLRGTVGMGRDVAIAFRGSATARTVVVGFDAFVEEGGFL